MNDPQNHFDWERFIGLLLAIGVVIAFVAFLFTHPEIKQLTLPIVRFLAALAAGLSAYLFAGSLDFVGSLSNRLQIRAAGAFATFVVVFFLFNYGLSSDLAVSNPPPPSPPPEIDNQELPNSPLELEDEISPDYSTLEELLSSANWRAADQETAKIMLNVVGRSEQGTIEPGLLENFPCKELQEIDSLWVKYSDEKFGFSVQEKIWADLGSPTVITPNRISAINELITFVGWGLGDVIFSYDDFVFDIESAPRGHLPAWLHDTYCFGAHEQCVWETLVAPLVRTEICT